MKTATFDNSVKVLLKAYLNDTLEHNNCHACAVGNLIADSCDVNSFTLSKSDRKVWSFGRPLWQLVFQTASNVHHQYFDMTYYIDGSKRQIDSTGYSVKDLAKIEFAFETANKGKSKDDYMFNGLMAVIDVLAEIHNVDLTTVKETKELFV